FSELLSHGGRLVRPVDTKSSTKTRKATSPQAAVTRPIGKRPPARKASAPLSTLTIQDLDGQTISSASWPGKVTIVNFWATWCPPCRTEIPHLVEIQRAYGSELQIIGISVDHASAESVSRFAIDHGINYPVAMVTGDLRRRLPGVRALPTSFVLDSKGRIIRTHVGMITIDFYQRVIRKLTIPS
ncbi:MAG: TlpA family protein disulfide reductase, partial [Vicinamibacterales bacterium]